MARFVALLRAVNVAHRKLPMAALRDLCAELGWEAVETYIQSGNVVATARGEAGQVENSLETAIARRFGLAVPVIARPAARWRATMEANPFPRESEIEPNRVLVGFAKAKLAAGAAAAIESKAAAGERVGQAGEALWFHYPQGVGRSKLTPALIDCSAGSPVTARNWRTVLKLGEMVEA